MADGDKVFRTEKAVLQDATEAVIQDRKELQDIAKALKDAYHQIQKQGADRETVYAITHILTKAKDREFLIAQKLEYLDTINKKLANFDVSLFPDLQSIFKKVSGQQRVLLREYVQKEHSQIYQKYNLPVLTELGKNYTHEFEEALGNAIVRLGHYDVAGATIWLKKAIITDKKLDDVLKRILEIEQKLLKITKGKLQEFEKWN